MFMNDAAVISDTRSLLGEGPVWWERAVWFVDIEGRLLNRFEVATGALESFEVPGRIGFAVPSDEHGWVIGQDAGVCAFRPGEGEPRQLQEVEAEEFATRMNDGKCDPGGRLFAGTMHLAMQDGAGALYRFGAGVKPTMVVDGVTISNGLAWDQTRGVMYYIDTPTGRVDRFAWDPDSGAISKREPVATLKDGSPDGMCIDREGRLWVALWGGSRVACVDPEAGREVSSIPVGARNVTSCCFGGDKLDELYITTARIGMDDAGLAESPSAGGLFRARPGVQGFATTPMKRT